MPKITPFLWFDTQAEEAMNFYASIFKRSKAAERLRRQLMSLITGERRPLPVAG
jgi:predicted 3-demethylubiquinone-9 3-methyltransferase (glyoxalase superfamily)